MVRLVGIVAIALIISAVVSYAVRDIRRIAATRRSSPRPGGYDWERRRDQLSRRVKGVPAPEEDRRLILGFLDTRKGVEAFIEPKTAVSPLSVVLVAGDGEWIRVTLADDAFIRDLARGRRLRAYDASRTGYPERMRRHRPDDEMPPSS